MAKENAKIPVIDISAEGKEQAQVARDLVEAAVEHGFIYVKNTGKDIPVEAIENAFNMSKEFFTKTPLEEKARCKILENNRGWTGMQFETLDPKNQRIGDHKEAFNFGEFANGKAQQPLPSTIVPFEGQISQFRDLCYHMCLKLNTLLGTGLEVQPPDFFTSAHLREKGPSGTTLRVLYYPPLSSIDGSRDDVRAGAHSDYGSMTMLFRLRGQAGLEILTRENTWAPVPVTPPGTEDDPAPPILVNIGDLLSYWTGGLLRSTVHRVVFPAAGSDGASAGVAGAGAGAIVDGESDAEPRYSMAFFCHPVGSTRLTPVPSERVRAFIASAAATAANGDASRQEYPREEQKVVTADEHLQMRLRATYLQLYNDKEE